jgi:hypothetical protein
MAYIVARKGGRFEIRESLYTPGGPRSRTLAGFRVLTDQILDAAAQRAQRPFDQTAVIRSGRRAGARIQVASPGTSRARDRFLAGSRRMAETIGRPTASAAGRTDPGAALLELLGFADTIRAAQPSPPREPLRFPPLTRIAEQRRATAATARGR